MEEIELNNLIDAWIIGQNAEQGTSEYKNNWWAISEIIDWNLEGKDELLWRFILAAYKREMPNRVIAVFAAGPLEDLLAKHGRKYIDRIEELARRDEKFNMMLGGVWRNTMTDNIWARVQAIRKEIW